MALARLFAKELQRLYHRHVAHREKNRFVLRRTIVVAVPAPQRQYETIALVPLEFLAIDHGNAIAAKGVVNRAVIMPMGLG